VNEKKNIDKNHAELGGQSDAEANNEKGESDQDREDETTLRPGTPFPQNRSQI
jgi:hypothetical protein